MKKFSVLVAVSFVLVFAHSVFATDPVMMSKGQTVYVPATWQEITSNNQRTSSRLVIRSIDPQNSITVENVLFFESGTGQFTKNLLDGKDCNGDPNGGLTNVVLGGGSSISFVTSEETVCVERAPQSELGRPFWLVEWRSTSGRSVIAPMIGGSIDILTHTSVFGHTGTPYYIVQSNSPVEGVVIKEK